MCAKQTMKKSNLMKVVRPMKFMSFGSWQKHCVISRDFCREILVVMRNENIRQIGQGTDRPREEELFEKKKFKAAIWVDVKARVSFDIKNKEKAK